MTLSIAQDLLGLASGGLVGFTLGCFGGGGSILAVPLMVYLVRVPDPHVAIGTSALAVSANAATNLLSHARSGTVKWRCGAVFALAGVLGAAVGSTVGKGVDGHRLLALFAGLMLAVAVLMVRTRSGEGDPAATLNRRNAPRLAAIGSMTGALSGFFGIGGGFLIVPGLMVSARMPILFAVSSSLISVAAFGLTTALNYALAGWVDWELAALFLAGGAAGGFVGARLTQVISLRSGRLNLVFAGLIVLVAGWILFRSFDR